MDDAERDQARALGEEGARPDPRVEALGHELALSREIRRRLEGELRRLEARVTALETEAGHLRDVLSERERRLEAIQGSLVWRFARALRRLLGRAT